MPTIAMTYNIKNGGRSAGDTSRLAAITRVIVAHRPDVVALQELGQGQRALRRLSDDTGMRAFPARSWLGQPVAVLVRSDAAVPSAGAVRRPFHHAAARVTVDTDRGPLTIISAHLCPYSGRRRLWEARWLARYADPARMVLLMGDLNSLDPWTDHQARLAALPSRYRPRHLLPGQPPTVDTRAIARLSRAGFADLFRPFGPGPDGKDYTAPTMHGGGQEFSRMRLDYIMGTRPVTQLVRHCRVLDGGETEYASDHYPVIAELNLRL